MYEYMAAYNKIMTEKNDLCFMFNGKYVDIVQEYKGTWVVYYEGNKIGEGHTRAGTGYQTRKVAFDFAKREIGFPNEYRDEVKKSLDACGPEEESC